MKTKSTNSINSIGLLVSLFAVMIALALILPVITLSQSSGKQTIPIMTSDGNGGNIITWYNKNDGKNEIYAQRMNSDSSTMWSDNGIPICTQDSNYNPIIVSDGGGGAIIAWLSCRAGTTADIFAQRVNSNGDVMWTTNGIPVCAVEFEQNTIAIVSDGSGGAIITWEDYRCQNGFAGIYAQRVNANGAMLWSANGVQVGFNISGLIALGNIRTMNVAEFPLSQFSPVTVINYHLSKTGYVKSNIYDAGGQKVNILVNESQGAVNNKKGWVAIAFPSGVYFYPLETGSYASNKNMILVK